MNCPRCGLSIRLRASYLTLERCPRCVAKSRVAVAMVLTDEPRGHRPAPARRSGEREGHGGCRSGVNGHAGSAPGQLVITATRDARGLVLSLHGELDIASAPALEGRLRAAEGHGSGPVVVDLGGLEFVDSAGLHVLIDAHRRLRDTGQGMSVRRGPRSVQRMLELTDACSILTFEE